MDEIVYYPARTVKHFLLFIATQCFFVLQSISNILQFYEIVPQGLKESV